MNNHFDSNFGSKSSNNSTFNNNYNHNNTIYYNSSPTKSNICVKDTSYMLARNEGYITIHYNNIPWWFMRDHCS